MLAGARPGSGSRVFVRQIYYYVPVGEMRRNHSPGHRLAGPEHIFLRRQPSPQTTVILQTVVYIDLVCIRTTSNC